jgi:high-affinity iron transporter
MLATLVIVFREVIEAGLVIGIVLAATKGVPGRGWWVARYRVGGFVVARGGRLHLVAISMNLVVVV